MRNLVPPFFRLESWHLGTWSDMHKLTLTISGITSEVNSAPVNLIASLQQSCLSDNTFHLFSALQFKISHHIEDLTSSLQWPWWIRKAGNVLFFYRWRNRPNEFKISVWRNLASEYLSRSWKLLSGESYHCSFECHPTRPLIPESSSF